MVTPHPLLLFAIIFSAMLVRYFALAGTMVYVLRRSKRTPLSPLTYGPEQHRRDIQWSVLSTAIFAASGVLLWELWLAGKTRIYHGPAEWGLAYLMLSLPLLMFLQDTYFYWTHRLLHLPAFFRPFHLAHHQSKVPTAWTSFSFHPVEALLQALFLPLLLALVPVHWSVLILFLATMTFFGVFNHLGFELLPSFLEKKLGLITARHHHQHHLKLGHNYGLFFNWWDLLMKTELHGAAQNTASK